MKKMIILLGFVVSTTCYSQVTINSNLPVEVEVTEQLYFWELGLDVQPTDSWGFIKYVDTVEYAMKARRNSDDATKDIPFRKSNTPTVSDTSGEPFVADNDEMTKCDFTDTGRGVAMCGTDWCGDDPPCSVFINTLYNQHGTEDFVQTTTALQPKAPETNWLDGQSAASCYQDNDGLTISNYLNGVDEIEIWVAATGLELALVNRKVGRKPAVIATAIDIALIGPPCLRRQSQADKERCE